MTTIQRDDTLIPSRDDVESAIVHVRRHARCTPVFTSRLLSETTGYEVFLKAENLQRTGSYKLRGPLNKIARMSDAERQRGVICSSAGNHAQGVALAASLNGVRCTVVMAENATPSKIAATRAYGADVVLAGSIWDEANDHAVLLTEQHGYTYLHPFDDGELIAGQGTLGLELEGQVPELAAVVVPIGGGGLISGIATALERGDSSPSVIGVESSGAPAMQMSVRAGALVTLDHVDTVIDGLRVTRVGRLTHRIVSDRVDKIVTLPDQRIFDALLWTMAHCKLVVEGAAAATVGALLDGLIDLPAGSKVVCVLSGGNVDLSRLSGMIWN